jgi:3-deoxy-7-phosphoheptulonate synthase
VGCIAAGVDGLMVEVHPFPEKAWSDKDQAIDLETVKRIYKRCEKLSKAE